MVFAPLKPNFSEVDSSHTGALTSASGGTTFSSAASANTYGSWTRILGGATPAFSFDVHWIAVHFFNTGASATTKNAYVDIGFSTDTGTTSTNVTTVVEKLGASSAGSAIVNGGCFYVLPVRIPAGTNLFMRAQGTAASTVVGVMVQTYGGMAAPGEFPSASSIVALGATTASTTGTAVVPASSGGGGTWTQIVASTTDNYVGFLVSSHVVDTTFTATCYTFDIAIGSAGNETLIGQFVHTVWQTTAEVRNTISFPVFVSVPAGSRIAVRGSCNGTPDTNISVVVHAMRA